MKRAKSASSGQQEEGGGIPDYALLTSDFSQKASTTRDDPFEKVLREERRQRAFPLGLCIAAMVATGMGLMASAAGMQWGAAPPAGDALREAWVYVNVAALWTWLLVWPAAALGRRELRRSALWFDLAVLTTAVMPAMTVAAMLSDVSAVGVERAVAVHVGVAMLAMGVLAWDTRVPAGVLGGVMAMLAAAMPVLGYLWSEFFASWPQGWIGWTPVGVMSRAIVEHGRGTPWLMAGIYGVTGLLLLISAPGRRAAT